MTAPTEVVVVWLTTEDVAARIGMDPEYVRRQCAAGNLAAKKLGTVWRIHPEDLETFMRGSAAPAAREKRLTARQARQQRHGP